jgi:chaperone required for assembly of F1-ATPase
MTHADGERPGAGKDPVRPLAKRFYKSVDVGLADALPSAQPAMEGPGKQLDAPRLHRVLLDGRPLRTPAKRQVLLPTRVLAEAVAEEWASQVRHIDPTRMPLTRLVNSAIDGVTGREEEVRADIVKYAGSDLLCYRAGEPEPLVGRQAEHWDPILAWSREALGAPFRVGQGLMPVEQSPAALSAIDGSLQGSGAMALAAIHVMTTLTGSALLALAHARGRLSAEDAWAAAHVDEDWQIGKWGEDEEAQLRRQRRWSEMQAASRLLVLLA